MSILGMPKIGEEVFIKRQDCIGRLSFGRVVAICGEYITVIVKIRNGRLHTELYRCEIVRFEVFS